MIAIDNKCDFGKIKIDLKPIMDKQHITPYRLSKLTGIKYQSIKRYCENDLYRIDLTNLAKICYALGCKSYEIVKYENDDN